MDPSSDNSSDSIEIGILANMNPMGVAIPTEVTVSDPNSILNGVLPALPMENHSVPQPRVMIVEQPQQRGFRFRYECEGPSHGGLQGVKSERGRKTYPAIKIENYDGPARIEVSLVTDENPPKIHAHKLVGKNCADGICTVEISSTASEISFSNLCVLHVTRKKASEVLLNRILQDLKLHKNLSSGGMVTQTTTDEEKTKAKKQAKEQAQNMSLNVVRLQFRVFLLNAEKQVISMLQPVVSHSIYDSKSPGASTLKICRMDKYGGCCTGNEEVFLLCEKVQKEDIAVRFVEQNPDGSVKWEAYGNFSPLDVHRQYAIVFKTPAYYNANIDKAVNVMIMLQRKSDADVSEAKAFTYYPQNKDKDLIARKKRKKLPLDNSFNYYGGDDGPPGPDGGLGGGYGGPPGGPGGGGGMNGGGGVGNGGQGNFSVIMPNGSVVSHMNMLPTTVEQVVKEEFDRCNLESPESIITESASPMASPYDPMLWNGEVDDLETDAAASLRHPSQTLVTMATPTGTKHSPKVLEAVPERASHGDRTVADRQQSEQKNDHPESSSSTPMRKGKPSEQYLKAGSKENTTLDPSGKNIADTETLHPSLAVDRLDDVTLDPSDEMKGLKEPATDFVHSPTKLSEVSMWSEGKRTDEGFSETSSVKEEPPGKKHNSTKPEVTKGAKEVAGQTPCAQIKIATKVVKRVMERITSRTVRALQDFSETGDIRYLLIVQRHLTAFKNENGDLPIHLAVINNQTTSLCYLLDVMTSLPNAYGIINAYNYMRQTALHLAAIMQQSLHIEFLLHSGADPSLADRNGNTPAHLAVLNNSVEALRALVKYLRPGVSATCPFPELNYLNYDGYSPVHLAAQNGSVEILRLLLHGKANMNLADGKSGRTALHHAVEQEDLPVAGFLLMEANADVNTRCFDGNTPLHVACCRGLMGMVALLMTAGARADIENEEIPPGEGSEEEGEAREETPHRWRRGLLPGDYATGKDRLKIMRMLKGDGYRSDGEEEEEEEQEQEQLMEEDDRDLEEDTEALTMHKSDCDSGVAVSLRLHSDGSASSLVLENKLSAEVRAELCKLLDPVEAGKDVYALAGRLGYSDLVGALEVMGCSGASPTLYLLDYHETYGTVSKLWECLKSMQREDAVRLIERPPTGTDVVQKQQLKELRGQSPLGDSGVVTFSS